MKNKTEAIRDFFNDSEWLAIERALGDYQDYGEEEAKIADSIEAKIYKLFKSDIINNINLTSKGFEFCSEVTAKILKKNINIAEVPINYYPRKKKDGKKIKWTDGLIALKTLIKCKLIND